MNKKTLKQLYKEFGEPKQDKENISSIANIFYEIGIEEKKPKKKKDILKRLLSD